LRINDTLKMWYCGSTNSIDNGSIGYAWSVEQYVWNVFFEPVLEPGELGAWDDLMAFHPTVYYDGTMYHMIYVGVDDNTTTWQLGYASSSNGISWEKYEGNPVMQVQPETFYEAGIINGCPVMYNDTIHLFFTGFDGTSSPPSYYSYLRIGYATSPDLKNWDIHPEPVLVGDPGEWDEHVVAGPSVMIHDDYYKMWYQGGHDYSSWEIGYALGDYAPPIINPQVMDYSQLAQESIYVYPDPFVGNVTISYTIQERSMVQIEIYNYNGQRIITLVNDEKQQGNHEVIFEGTELQPGVYFCTLKTNQGIQTKKIIKLL